MVRLALLLRALVSRKWRWVTLVVLLIMAGFARLGVWQLARLAERRAANVELLAVLESGAVDVNTAVFPTLSNSASELAPFKDRQAVATGHFDFEQQGVIKLQVWQGRAGAYLLAPLVLDDGKTAVLVNRGWIPEAEKNNLAQYHQTGEVTIEGYLAQTQTLSRNSQTSPPIANREWFRVDIAQIQQSVSYDLLPVYIVQTPTETPQAAPPFRAEQVIDLSEGPHLGYAIQWFIFAVIGGVGYLVFISRSLQKEPAGSNAH